MIAAIAGRSPAPRRQWVRGGKFLAEVTWNGRVAAEAFPSRQSMDSAIRQTNLAGVLLLRKGEAVLPYQEKLNAVLDSHPDEWRSTGLSPGAVLYERLPPGPNPGRTVPLFVPRLRRILGGK